jgi:uncharacterized protein YecA (UPF0149 family)
MGVIADGLAAYAKPLLDKHSSSLEQLQYAMMLAQICWNIAVTPEEKHESRILELQKTFQLSDTEFLEFRKDIVEPMIQRHKDMFPKMRPGRSDNFMDEFIPSDPYLKDLPPKIGRNSLCPCNSGKKFKQCCGKPGSYRFFY